MKAVGIVLAGGNSPHMKELSQKRALSAMPIAGSFRAIDFTLSNMSNSHVKTVAVLSQYNARSLNEHLNSAKWWDFGRKQGGLFVFTPTITTNNSWWYRGTADAMWQNIDFLRDRHEPYVIITNGDVICKIDFEKVLNYHVDTQAEITVVCAHLPKHDEVAHYGTVKMNAEGVIENFDEKPIGAQSDIISAGIYVMRRRKLIELLEECNDEGRYNFVTDILMRHIGTGKIYGYMLHSYWSNIATVDSYFRTNMDFLKDSVREFFFKEEPFIYSKALDVPPTKYNPTARVSNSLVGSGTILNGTVEDSILFKKVYIGNNSFIKNSIVLHGAYIGDNVRVENCIIEANVRLLNETDYIGKKGVRIVSEGQNIV